MLDSLPTLAESMQNMLHVPVLAFHDDGFLLVAFDYLVGAAAICTV